MRCWSCILILTLVIASCGEDKKGGSGARQDFKLTYSYPSDAIAVMVSASEKSLISSMMVRVGETTDYAQELSRLSREEAVLTCWLQNERGVYLAQTISDDGAFEGETLQVSGLEVQVDGNRLSFVQGGLELRIFDPHGDSATVVECFKSYIQSKHHPVDLSRDKLVILPHQYQGLDLAAVADSLVVNPDGLDLLECRMYLKPELRGVLKPSSGLSSFQKSQSYLSMNADPDKAERILIISGVKAKLDSLLAKVQLSSDGLIHDWTGRVAFAFIGEMIKKQEIVDYRLNEETFEMEEVKTTREHTFQGMEGIIGTSSDHLLHQLLESGNAVVEGSDTLLNGLWGDEVYLSRKGGSYIITNTGRGPSFSSDSTLGEFRFRKSPVSVEGEFSEDAQGNPILHLKVKVIG